MENNQAPTDLLWRNISALPYFRGFLRAVEGSYYQDIQINGLVLDLGCGDGHFSSVTFADRPLFLIGIDPELGSLVEASQYRVFSHLVCAHGDKLPFPDHFFKNAVSNSVLEHIPEVEAVLMEARRVIQANGKLIACMPNNNLNISC